jgi:hypothetical protein
MPNGIVFGMLITLAWVIRATANQTLGAYITMLTSGISIPGTNQVSTTTAVTPQSGSDTTSLPGFGSDTQSNSNNTGTVLTSTPTDFSGGTLGSGFLYDLPNLTA